MISSVCLFKNLREITSNIKTKTKHVFDRSFQVTYFLYKLEDSGALFEPYFWLPSRSILRIVSRHYLKTNIYIN